MRRQVLGTAAITYLGIALSVFSAPMLARSLGADGRGAVAACFLVVQVLNVVGCLGLPRTLSRDHARGDPVSRRGVVVLTAMGTVGAVVIFVTAPLFAEGQDRIVLGARLAALVFPLNGIASLGSQVLVATGRTARFNLVRGIPLVLPSLVVIAAFLLDVLTFQVAFLAQLVAMAISYLVGTAAAISVARSSVREAATDWTFALSMWSSSSLDVIGQKADQMVAATVLGVADLGVYAVAITCASASAGLSQAMNQVAFGKLLAQERRDAKAAGRFSTSFNRRRTAVSVASSATMVVVIVLFGTAIFGADFEQLGAVVAVTCTTQVFRDQWSWRVYATVATRNSHRLAVAVAASLVVFGLAAAGLAALGLLTVVTLAGCALLAMLARLGLARTVGL